MTIIETWRTIPRHPGYEASDLGRVRSVDRMIVRSNGRRQTLRGRVLRPSAGRPQVVVNGRTRYVHHLVLLTFVGPCPPGLQCCHRNDDPSDNRLINLRWDSSSANHHDAVRNGRHALASRDRCPRGHALVAPNLVPSWLRRGGRGCLACHRARSNPAGAAVPLRLLADLHYGLLHIAAGLPLPEIDYNQGKIAA